jgi:hypothetical protein
MQLEEFSELFDVNYNNITSNQAPGLNEYEKSVFLTKAQDEIIKNYFTANSKGNNIQQGFDDSAKRQADFSLLMKTASCDPGAVDQNTGTTSIKKYICTSSHPEQSDVVLYGSDITFTSGGEVYPIEDDTYSVSAEDTITIPGTPATVVTVNGFPFASGTLVISTVAVVSTSGKIDQRSKVYTFPSDVFIIINEALADIPNKKYFQVIPLRYDEYTRLMSKPFKRPLKHQAWRLINSGIISGSNYIKCVELITTPEYDNKPLTYTLRFLRRPRPIIVGDIDDLKINGYSYDPSAQCELDPILHEDILQRAVELAKVAWTATGQDNTQAVLAAGQRSE